MAKSKMLKILNPILALLVITQGLSAVLGDQLPREAFEVIHEGGGAALLVGIILHVVLNWNWVHSNFLKAKRS